MERIAEAIKLVPIANGIKIVLNKRATVSIPSHMRSTS